ncbi:MAG: four helix bundle protein [Planctomycetota bacterium]
MGRLTGDLKERTLRFGVEVLGMVGTFPQRTVGWVVGKQLARCATSIGANVWEANAAFSDPDFAHKISIAHKEGNETQYWLEISRRADLLDSAAYDRLHAEVEELICILATIVRKTRNHIDEDR